MPPIKLEIPIFSSSLPPLALPPASRLELSAPGSYPSGGLTPPLALLQSLPALLPSPRPALRVMIRPRPAPRSPSSSPDFLYTGLELASMLASIRSFKPLLDPSRGDGFVFGVLRDDPATRALRVDVARNAELVGEAAPLGCTFHRAFDDVLATGGGGGGGGAGTAVQDAVEDVLRCGFDGVLTSGGRGNAVDNLGALGRVAEAAGGRMDVLVGGGVRAANAGRVLEAVRGSERVWLHSSCLRAGGEEEVDEKELRALVEAIETAA